MPLTLHLPAAEAFESWLEACPLADFLQEHAVVRTKAGFTVTCSWFVPTTDATAAPPPATAAARSEPPPAAAPQQTLPATASTVGPRAAAARADSR